MSELIESGAPPRKDLLKHLILQLHAGTAPEAVRRQLVRALGQVPYGLVVEVEQELIEEGLPPAEVQRLCELHASALEGAIDLRAARRPPPGHPAQVLSAENAALAREAEALLHACDALDRCHDGGSVAIAVLKARVRVNALADVEKHYARKEHLLFPFLERHGITGPPQVMWGKHDETRALLRGALAALSTIRDAQGARAVAAGALRPLAAAIRGMIEKEETILLPMCLDVLDAQAWWEIARGSGEIGWCLVEPEADWRPEGVVDAGGGATDGKVRLPTGTLGMPELEAILGALPIDATFVDADDRVRWFSHGEERVFSRSKAVLGRKVQLCHPPSSVDTVDRILEAFKAGTEDRAAFWIQMRGRFVHIEYRALRGADGAYLGCLEVTQDLTEKRALTGEQRILSWAPGATHAAPPAAGDAPPASAEPAAPGRAGPAAPEPEAAGCPGHSAGAGPRAEVSPRPAWVDPQRVTRRLDARPLLAAGQHPVQQVMQDLGALSPGEIYELVTPFVPGPLLERAGAVGCLGHAEPDGEGAFRTFFTRGAVA